LFKVCYNLDLEGRNLQLVCYSSSCYDNHLFHTKVKSYHKQKRNCLETNLLQGHPVTLTLKVMS